MLDQEPLGTPVNIVDLPFDVLTRIVVVLNNGPVSIYQSPITYWLSNWTDSEGHFHVNEATAIFLYKIHRDAYAFMHCVAKSLRTDKELSKASYLRAQARAAFLSASNLRAHLGRLACNALHSATPLQWTNSL